MRPQIFSTRFGMLALGLALFGWLLAPSEPEAPGQMVRVQRDDWGIEDMLRRPLLSALAVEVGGASLWGMPSQGLDAKAAGAPAAIEDTRWRMAGLFGRGAERRVLIVFYSPGKAPQYLKVGEALPSGHRIASIHDREICVQIGKRAYRFAVQRSEP